MLYEETAVTVGRRHRLKTCGPIISVRLERPPGGTEPYPPLDVTALIDTGACGVYIQAGIADELGLPVVGSGTVSTPTHRGEPVSLYRVKLTFSAGFYLEMQAAEVPLERQQYRCLIGRDVLKHARFTYDGLTGTFSLDF